MKQVDTEPGSQYSVDSAAGCTVSTPAGQVICRVMPGILGSFMASGYVTCFSDDAAGVTLVASGTPGGTGGQQMQISQALDAANRAEAAREKAVAAAGDAEEAAARAEELKGVVLEVAAGAALDAEMAVAAKDEAVLAMGAAEKAKADADASKMEAQTAESNAKASETQAAADKAAAERAKTDAQAAQSSAEEQAAIATAAAEAALAPESIAAQAARPATMCILKDGLLRIVGDPALFTVDTDGQKIIVHTDRLEDEQLASVEDMLGRFVPQFIEVVQYNHHIEVSWMDANKYALCTNATELCSVEPEKVVRESYGFGDAVYTTDFTSDGQFGYPIPKMATLNTTGYGGSVFAKTPAEIFRISAPALINGGRCLRLISSKEIYLDAPNVNTFSDNGLLKTEKIWCNSEKIEDMYNAFNSPYLREVQIVFPLLKTGKWAFEKSILNKESTLRILNSIPEWSDGKTHELTIGIHVDHQADDEVLDAIANAESRGWTLTVQWNGKPTAQAATTYGLRKPPIYAKVSEMENGERYLDWGHYVSDPTGYEEFRSVEAAREHFGLPDEDLTETE